MTLTRDARNTVMERVQRDPAFAGALLHEAAALAHAGEPELAARLLEPLDALGAAIQAGAASSPGVDAEVVFTRLENK